MTQEKSTASGLVLNLPEINSINISLPFIPDQNNYAPELKRTFDITVAAVLTVMLLSWLCPIICLLIKISSKGPAIFIQKRIGQYGKIFLCYKFRTMYLNNEADTRQVMMNDKRITRIGAFLRKTHIDELPQLINVLRGDMSMVGPRPHMLCDHKQFSKMLPEYRQRHLMKPGITGLAQVKGYHGIIADYHLISGRTRLDIFYTRKASLGLDFLILINTLSLIFHRKTMHHE